SRCRCGPLARPRGGACRRNGIGGGRADRAHARRRRRLVLRNDLWRTRARARGRPVGRAPQAASVRAREDGMKDVTIHAALLALALVAAFATWTGEDRPDIGADTTVEVWDRDPEELISLV